MTQEVLFRGKLSHNNKWLIGNLVFSQENTPYIIPSNVIEQDGHHLSIFDDNVYWVDKNTVGQYTGIKDRNNIRIFDGDIIKDIYTDKIYTVFYVAGGFVIESNPESFGYGSQNGTNPTESLSDMQMRGYIEDNCNVIGNIYDNKELLK